MGTFDLTNQAKHLINYKQHGYWTPDDKMFDIGMTTSRAIDRLINLIRDNKEKEFAHLRLLAKEGDNGNSALMRIFPLYAFLRNQPVEAWFEYIWLHSALTHGHIRSAFCCFLYLR